MDQPRFRVCLDREVVLAPVRIPFREWPGQRGPVVVTLPTAVHDPSWLAPRWRVLSLVLRSDVPCQVQAWDMLGLLDQFGFLRPVLVGGYPCLLLAAWFPRRIAGLVLVGALDRTTDHEALRARVTCPILNVPAPLDTGVLESFLERAC